MCQKLSEKRLCAKHKLELHIMLALKFGMTSPMTQGQIFGLSAVFYMSLSI